jgi:hypothetical protein
MSGNRLEKKMKFNRETGMFDIGCPECPDPIQCPHKESVEPDEVIQAMRDAGWDITDLEELARKRLN